MHICLIRQYFNRQHGGAERYAVNLAHGLLEHDHRISIVCSSADENDARDMEVTKIGRAKWAGPWRHLAWGHAAGRVAAKSGADLVLALARAVPCDVARLGDPPHAAWLKLKYPDRRTYLRALKQPRHKALLAIERELTGSNGAKLLVANSELVKSQMVDAYSIEPDRVQVIRNPVDQARFHPDCEDIGIAKRKELGIPPEAVVVLFSGMDYPRKGLTQAATAFVRLLRKSPAEESGKLRFLVVGRGNAEPARRILTDAACADRMLVEPESLQIDSYYAAANVFLLPTLYDPAANAVSEALACGTPVVTTKMNGASELIRPGINGDVVNSRDDIEGIAAAAAKLLGTERVQRSRAYVAMATRIPTWNDAIDTWEALLIQQCEAKWRARLRPVTTVVQRDEYTSGGQWLVRSDESKRTQKILQQLPDQWPRAFFKAPKDKRLAADSGVVRSRYRVRGERTLRDRFVASDAVSEVEAYAYRRNATAGGDAFEGARLLIDAGLKVAPPLAAGSDGKRSFILFGRPAGIPIHEYFRRAREFGMTSRLRAEREGIRALARLLATLHNLGLRHKDLSTHHLGFVLDPRAGVHGVLLSIAGLECDLRLSRAIVVEDLAHLHRETPASAVRAALRIAFLKAYVLESRRNWSLKSLLKATVQLLTREDTRQQRLDKRKHDKKDSESEEAAVQLPRRKELAAVSLEEIDELH